VVKTLDVPVDSLSTQTEISNNEIREKAAAFDNLMDEKLTSLSDSKSKIQILTLLPTTWSIKKTSEDFDVSEYLVHTAHTYLGKRKGYFSHSRTKRGKPLSSETLSAVKMFYHDEKCSRQLPGKKRFCVSKNVHAQKRLILCNLRKLYSAFESKYP